MHRWHIKMRLIIYLFSLGCLAYVIYMRTSKKFSIKKHGQKLFKKNALRNELYNEPECRILYLGINDEDMALQHEPSNYNGCKLPSLVSSNLTSLTVNSRALYRYGIKNINQMHCSYMPLWIIDLIGNESGNNIQYGKTSKFKRSIDVSEEFVRVKCVFGKYIYEDFHSFVPIKEIKKITKRNGNDEKINIIMMGMSSLSRMDFHRQMPKLAKYLINDLKAIDFIGYNKLTHNTFSNLIPLLTGYGFPEYNTCWKINQLEYNNCSFIWENYSKEGYVTSFAGNFTILRNENDIETGLNRHFTDYSLKTFKNLSLKRLILHFNKPKISSACLNPKLMYKIMLDRQKKFVKTMINNRFFTFHWDEVAYHEINLAEEDYLEHLLFLKKEGILNSSLLIFFSGHGNSFSDIKYKFRNSLEENFPFMFFVLPIWFSKKYPIATSNLKNNALRLTTPFDVHATLNHILYPDKLTDEKLRIKNVSNNRSISLFLPVPQGRNCDSASIPLDLCMCQEDLPIEVTNPVALSAAKYVVDYINYLLKGIKNCQTLGLYEIIDASVTKYVDISYTVQKSMHDYTVSFKTEPGYMWFSATVRCTYCTEDFQISGAIHRLNTYADQSYCVADVNLKQYCYCE